MPDPTAEVTDSFISRWKVSGGHERGAGQQFLTELCALLELPQPDPPVATNELNTYTFERRVDRKKPDGTTSPNWIDLYKSGCFVLETKQGVNPKRDKSHPDQPLLQLPGETPAASAGHGQRGTKAFDKALERAHAQAERYIHSLPAEEGRPPFLIVCDVGHSIDLYAEFSGTGGQYERFPDPVSHRITLQDLHEPTIRERLRRVWTDPRALDPSKHAAAVTREVAKALADLAKSLEKDGHNAQLTAGFLQRCLFTMFAEDVGLLPADSFLGLLQKVKDSPQGFPVMLQSLWKDMATGSEFSTVLMERIPHFNGGLFEDTTALPLRPDQILFLIHAAKSDWSAVEPAIFGTLLERALDPSERHKLGAHYTPRSYVERLVRPTIIEPLREKWEAVKAAAAQLDEQGKTPKAREAVEDFHHELCKLRILDPACGTGNFLYVSLELLKRLEAEVLDLLEKLGGDRNLEMDAFKVRPDQFLGLEVNARAVAVAQLVLWIGYFQWQKRTSGKADTGDRPLLPKRPTIRQQDAVLAYDEKIPRKDSEGHDVTIWDGRTTKPHPVTGKEVPDESARAVVFDYTNPRRAEWPEADYVVGNPPFIGKKRIREALGDGYVEAYRKVWDGVVPDSADFVMLWWRKASELVAERRVRSFGLITTNSITQTFNERVVASALGKGKQSSHIAFAIPDHPWVDSSEGAAVRIAMTVVAEGDDVGRLVTVSREEGSDTESGESDVELEETVGEIAPNLKMSSHAPIESLSANERISSVGFQFNGRGFVITRQQAIRLNSSDNANQRQLAHPLFNGRDLAQENRGLWALDAHGLSEELLRVNYPEVYQHLRTTVWPERQTNKRASRKRNWWLYGDTNQQFRDAAAGIDRIVVTPITAKHRFFVMLPANSIFDSTSLGFALPDSYFLGLLSSSPHLLWALRAGTRLGVGNDPRYNKTRCFETFPCPILEECTAKQRIRDLGEKLDAHRKRQQELHPHLTLTGIYNVLEKLRAGEPLNDKDKKIHNDGLVTLLKQIHDELDEAVLTAYGWTDLLTLWAGAYDPCGTSECREAFEQELLKRLVDLNHERAEEEKRGLIRWLRPDYQASDAEKVPQAKQAEIELQSAKADSSASTIPDKLKWPKELPDQVAAIRKLLPALGPDPSELAARFGKRTKARITAISGILQTLSALGKL